MIDDYPTCARTYASLRFANGPDEPEVLSARLELEPSSMRKKGISGVWRGGEWRIGDVPPCKFNLWSISSEDRVDSKDCRRHIAYLLDLLTEKEAVVARLIDEGWEVDIFAFWESKWGSGGPMLDPAIMSRLAALRITIGFDVYLATEVDLEG